MSMLAVEKSASLLTTPYTSYDKDKWNLGELIFKRSDLGIDFIGAMSPAVFRPVESAVGFSGIMPWGMQWSGTLDWLFLFDNAAAAATRRVIRLKFNRSTCEWVDLGYITLTFPTATAHTIRGARMTYDKYVTGTAAVSGTAVTGTSTAWLASGIAVGSRIGFGSTDPTAISTWYEIGAVSSDTGITLTDSAGTIANGPYVIEELRCVISTTNATTTNGGLFVAKGLRPELFSPGGTTIPAATTIDGIRAVYWLADAATVTNLVACGCALKDRDSWTQHYAYVMDTLTPTKIFKYNIRAALAGLAAGKSVSAWVLTTGTVAVTGTNNQINNGRMVACSHGPGSGVLSFYFCTTTRVYRAAESGIVSASTTWISDAMVEIPPGSAATFPASAAMQNIEYAGTIDRFVLTTSGATAFRSYVTQYRIDSGQFDHNFTIDDKQTDQTTKDSDAPDHPTTHSVAFTCWTERGIAYLVGTGATAILNLVYAVPIGAHWTYAGGTPNQRLISPKMATIGAEGFVRAYWMGPDMLGGATKDALGISVDPVRIYYRITGIDDNSGSWTLIDPDGNLSGAGAADAIQLMFEFRTITQVMIPARIMVCGVIYTGMSSDSHYQPSVTHSDPAAKRFAWRFSSAFGSTVPTLYLRLYDAVTGALLLTDNTAAPTGTFEKSTDGGSSWVAWTNADKTNDITYLRYTPASLADGVNVRANLRTV